MSSWVVKQVKDWGTEKITVGERKNKECETGKGKKRRSETAG